MNWFSVFIIVMSVLSITTYGVVNKLLGKSIQPLFGAMLYSSIAIFLVILILVFQKKINILNEFSNINIKILVLILLGGVSVLGIDYFYLKMYQMDLPLSIVGPLITGLTLLFGVIIGYIIFKEEITWIKILGIFFILIGSSILITTK